MYSHKSRGMNLHHTIPYCTDQNKRAIWMCLGIKPESPDAHDTCNISIILLWILQIIIITCSVHVFFVVLFAVHCVPIASDLWAASNSYLSLNIHLALQQQVHRPKRHGKERRSRYGRKGDSNQRRYALEKRNIWIWKTGHIATRHAMSHKFTLMLYQEFQQWYLHQKWFLKGLKELSCLGFGDLNQIIIWGYTSPWNWSCSIYNRSQNSNSMIIGGTMVMEWMGVDEFRSATLM